MKYAAFIGEKSELSQKIIEIFDKFCANDICDGALLDAVIEAIEKENSK